MPSYEFTCRRGCGSFDRSFSMSAVPAVTTCPDCGAASRRRFGGAALVHSGSAATRLLDATARTASEPAVVTAPPPLRAAPVSRNPLHRQLPRP